MHARNPTQINFINEGMRLAFPGKGGNFAAV